MCVHNALASASYTRGPAKGFEKSGKCACVMRRPPPPAPESGPEVGSVLARHVCQVLASIPLSRSPWDTIGRLTISALPNQLPPSLTHPH